MATPERSDIKQEFKGKRTLINVKLGDLTIKSEIYSHRTDDELKPESVAELANSIMSEGLKEPLEVLHDPEVTGKYRIISGHRRRKALNENKKLDNKRFNDEMDVPVYLQEPSVGETPEEFALDTYMSSMAHNAENGVRKKVSDIKTLEFIAGAIERNASELRIRNTLGMTERDFERKKNIIGLEELWNACKDNYISVGYAGHLVEGILADDKPMRKAKLIESIAAWRKEADIRIASYIKRYVSKSKDKKEPSDKDRKRLGSSHLTNSMVQEWIKKNKDELVYDLTEGKLNCVMVLDQDGLKITSVNKKLDEIKAEELQDILDMTAVLQKQASDRLDVLEANEAVLKAIKKASGNKRIEAAWTKATTASGISADDDEQDNEESQNIEELDNQDADDEFEDEGDD